MINRLKLNILVDIVSFVIFIPVAISSFVLYYALPRGSGGNNTLILGLTRGDWLGMHYITGFILISLVIIHLVLHWYMIKNLLKMFKP